jgi:5-methylcytosine-specific restriction endonuclease McrA
MTILGDLLGGDWAVYMRDGFKCQICGWTPGHGVTAGLEIDHKIPLSRGGADTFENKQVLCAPHNAQKGTMTDTEYRLHLLLGLGR